MSLKHLFIMLGEKVSRTTKGKPLLHLPRGGPCVMRMSMPSGMRFHLSSRDWPLGRLKPHPLNHGVLWGDNAHGIRPAEPRFCPAIVLSRTFPQLSFLFLMVGPGSRTLFCWLLQNQSIWEPVWSLRIVQVETGAVAFAVETFPEDFYQNCNNALSPRKPQSFLRCSAQIRSIATLPIMPQSWEIPSVSTSFPHHCGAFSPERCSLKSLERRTSALKAETAVCGEHLGLRMLGKTWGLWEVRKDTVNKRPMWNFLPVTKGKVFGDTLESTLLTVSRSSPPTPIPFRNLCSRNEGLGSMPLGGGVYFYPSNEHF